MTATIETEATEQQAPKEQAHVDPAPAAGPVAEEPALSGDPRLFTFEKVGRARLMVQQEELRARNRLLRWSTWPGHAAEWEKLNVKLACGTYISKKLTHAGAVAKMTVAEDGTYNIVDETGYVIEKSATSGVFVSAKLGCGPPRAMDRVPPVLRVSVDEGRAGSSGLYRIDSEYRLGMPVWRRKLGEDRPALVLVCDAMGRWALTTEDRVADGRHFLVSRPHRGALPHTLTSAEDWGKLQQGEMQPFPFTAEPCASPHIGAEVEVRGVKALPELNKQRGIIVAQQGDRWGVRFHEASFGEKALRAETLVVCGLAPPQRRLLLTDAAGHQFVVEQSTVGVGELMRYPFSQSLRPSAQTMQMLSKLPQMAKGALAAAAQ